MSQRKDTNLNTKLWPKLVDHYILHDDISRFNLIAYSQKYNFNVHTYISFNTYVTELYQRYGWIILLLVGLSIVISRSVFLNVEKNSSVLIMKEGIDKNNFVPYGQPVMNANGELIADSSIKPVEVALNNHIQNLPFNGVLNLTKLNSFYYQ